MADGTHALSAPLVVAASLAYLLLLFAVAAWAERRARAGRSIIGNAWVYALSMAVYCTAWTYFGSVGRAAAEGVWFLPIYLGPTLAMTLAWLPLRKMIRIARRERITSIADFIASRYGKSATLAGLVTLIVVVGIVPYIALQLKAIAAGYALLTGSGAAGSAQAWWRDGTLAAALVLAAFTILFGTRQLDRGERHEGMVAAIAFESIVKLLAFVAVGAFVVWGLFDGLADLSARVLAQPELAALLRFAPPTRTHPGAEWFALTLVAMLSVFLLPRQFQVMVVENVAEQHLKRAAWVFPAYLLLINLFVLPIALGGLLLGRSNAETYVLSLPLTGGQPALALAAFVGGLSAATGMIIVETIAVSTMVCNDLVLPLLLRTQRFAASRPLARTLLAIRRAAIVAVLLLGWIYFQLAGEAYALVSIGLISFAAVAQFAPALLGGLYWKGGTRAGAAAGLAAGFALWAYTLMLPSIAKSGWWASNFVAAGPFGIAALRPEQLLGLGGLDALTHGLFWSLLGNLAAYVCVSLARAPNAAEASQALLFVDVFRDERPHFWRGRARVQDLLALVGRFVGADRARELFAGYAGGRELAAIVPDARLVHFAETQLAGAIGSASARVMVASVADEESLARDDIERIVTEARDLRSANEQLQSLDRMKDDFMSSVTHELRTPLTSIRSLAEMMQDDPEMDTAQRQQFLGIVVAEAERLSRLVNQVLDMAKIEAGQAEWRSNDVDLAALLRQAAQAAAPLLRERGAELVLHLPDAPLPPLRADADRLMQVLTNLLSNAAKFVPQPDGRVELRLASDAHGVQVEVHDNGPGVPPAQRELIFEKFRQGGDASRRPQGTGLGLPISRRIIEHYGGTLELRSDAGPGSCFRFTLPWPKGAP